MRSENCIELPRARVTGGYELSYMDMENQKSPLQEHQISLTMSVLCSPCLLDFLSSDVLINSNAVYISFVETALGQKIVCTDGL